MELRNVDTSTKALTTECLAIFCENNALVSAVGP